MQICSGRWWWPRVDDAAGPGSAGHLPRQEQPPYGHKPLVARVDHLFGHKLGVDPPDVLTIALDEPSVSLTDALSAEGLDDLDLDNVAVLACPPVGNSSDRPG